MRTIVNINHKWAFRKGAALPETFPADWDIINLPHSWNNIDGQDGGNDYWRGTGVYVQKLARADLPEAEACFLATAAALWRSSPKRFSGSVCCCSRRRPCPRPLRKDGSKGL